MGRLAGRLGVFALALGVCAAFATSVSVVRAVAVDPLVYVAMGDSYTSGPLVLPHDTTFVPEDCGQSYFNYPHLAEQTLKVDVFRDVSCGSATIDDFMGSQTAAAGSKVKPQFDALDPSVDVVTVGIGGNDVGFVSLALDCFRTTPTALGGEPDCTPQHFDHGVDQVSKKIAETEPELAAAIQRIHVLAPRAAVLIVSYPTAIPDDGVGCYPYVPIRNSDMPYLSAKFKEMNAMLQRAAERNNATYVDIYTPSIGHDPCKPPAIAWINGIVVVPPSYPAHPNNLSYLNSAPVVAQAITARLAQKSTAAPAAAPPTTTTTPPANTARARALAHTGADDAAALAVATGAIVALVLRRRYAVSAR